MTVVLDDGRSVRLQGLSLPAAVVRPADSAAALRGFLERRVLGREMLVSPDAVPEGGAADLVAVLRLAPDAASINRQALAGGLAVLGLGSPDVSDLEDLVAAAKEGQSERRGYWSRPDRRRFREPPYLNGAVLGLHYEADSARYDRQLDELAAAGFRHLTLLFPAFLKDVEATAIRRDHPRCPGDQQLLHTIRGAHERKMSVLLLPIVLLEEAEDDEWRGVLRPDDEGRFWRNYAAFLAHYLDLAEHASVEIFSVGSEFGSLESNTDAWRRIITGARGRFRGLLTYSANWDHVHVGQFFGDLDLLGMTAYFSLTEKDDPTQEKLIAAWRRVGREIAPLVLLHGKPVFFTELGYASQDGINRDPWNYYMNRDAIDLREQAQCFAAFIAVAPELSWLEGAYLYDYFDAGGAEDHSYSPRGKPAMEVWRRWATDGARKPRGSGR